MYPNNFFIPSYTSPFIPINTPRIGLFTRIGNTIKSVNWSRLLNGADRTLGLVNQAIPLVRETKPMFSNMKSMVKLAKAFRNETTPRRINNNQKIVQSNDESTTNPIKFFI